MNTCPKCGAEPGQPCWSYWPTSDGSYQPRPTWLPHAARMNLDINNHDSRNIRSSGHMPAAVSGASPRAAKEWDGNG